MPIKKNYVCSIIYKQYWLYRRPEKSADKIFSMMVCFCIRKIDICNKDICMSDIVWLQSGILTMRMESVEEKIIGDQFTSRFQERDFMSMAKK